MTGTAKGSSKVTRAARASGSRSPGGPRPSGPTRKAALDAKARAKACMMSGEVNTVTVDIGQSTASSIRTSAFLVGLDVMWFAIKKEFQTVSNPF